MRPPQFAPLAALAAAALLTLAACGSSGTKGDSASAPGTGSADNAAVAAARSSVEKYSAEQPPIALDPLPSAPKPGLTVAITTCPLPVCKTVTDAAADAAKKIGWHVKEYESELTPESYISTMTRVVNDKPDLIAYTPVVPNQAVQDQLTAAADAGIPIVVMAPAGDRPDKNGPVSASFVGYPQFYESGKLEGDVIVADGGTGKNTTFVWDPALSSIWNPVKAAFIESVGATGSEPEVLEAATAGIGKDVPGQIVSYLQSHPDVKYLAFALADYTVGVPEALSAAGLDGKVKIVSRAPLASNLANIKNGKEFASVGEETEASGWRAIDALARLSLGETPDDSWFEPAGWHQIFVSDNITDPSVVPNTPGFPDAFLTAWDVS